MRSMRALLQLWIVYVGVAFTSIFSTGTAAAAPKAGATKPSPGKPAPAKPATAQTYYNRAQQLDQSGDTEKALAVTVEGIGAFPKDLSLLGQRGALLLKLRDYAGALAAYQEFLAANPPRGDRRLAEKIVNDLRAVESTFLDITVENGPAAIYLDTKTLGEFCTAAPTCKKGILPGKYQVIVEHANLVERDGWKRERREISVQKGATEKLAIALVELPSQLTVRAAPEGAQITVDGAPHAAPGPVPAGKHKVAVSLAGHATKQLDIEARAGKPIELDIALLPVVPIKVAPAGATVTLDGQPAAIQDGALALAAGEHTLIVQLQGYDETKLVIPAERPADYQIAVELQLKKIVVAPPAPSPFTPRRKIALAAAGVGLAAMAGAVVLGRQAESLEADAYALCPDPAMPCSAAGEAQDLNDRGRSRALQANIAFGVAGGAVIGAAVLWFTGAPRAAESRVAVTPRLGSVAGLDVAVRF